MEEMDYLDLFFSQCHFCQVWVRNNIGRAFAGVVGWDGGSALILALLDLSVSAFDTINPSVPLDWLGERRGWHSVVLVHFLAS